MIFINHFNKTDFIIKHFIIYSGVFLDGDPTKLEEDHKSRSAPVGWDNLSSSSAQWLQHSKQMYRIYRLQDNFVSKNKSYPSVLTDEALQTVHTSGHGGVE